MDIRTMRFARVCCESVPTLLVEFRQMRLVLRIHNMNGVAAQHDDIRNELSDRTVTGIRPFERKDCLALSADTNCSACRGHLATHGSFNIAFPELIKPHGPSESVHLAATAEASLVDDPT